MSSFIDERLLDTIGYGTQVIPTNAILRKQLRSGVVRRRALRRNIREYAIICKLLNPADTSSVVNAFMACQDGESFRLRDRTDYRVDNQVLAVGTGAEQTIQLFKRYDFGTKSVERPIRKPVTGTVVITATTPPTGVTVDYTTGMATFTATASEAVRFSCEFDVPVMFADDQLPMETVISDGEGGILLAGDVSLIEDITA